MFGRAADDQKASRRPTADRLIFFRFVGFIEK